MGKKVMGRRKPAIDTAALSPRIPSPADQERGEDSSTNCNLWGHIVPCRDDEKKKNSFFTPFEAGMLLKTKVGANTRSCRNRDVNENKPLIEIFREIEIYC
jgi:hypothetical protein